ncbi:U-box domain-containing protein 34-like isoform X1 [Salvia splendens]|uniref:U-box domain-containing protein 34-like isoform X1 n=1 Tax=Salvia splendens TaxID=180675 RepID=UPI001C2663C7|nr:U-box domain-containing protein 34-like isoform X1 [Salvia splendens]
MTIVAVAVKSSDGRGSQRALGWAMENLMHTSDRLLLVRVMPPITCVPTPCTLASLSHLSPRHRPHTPSYVCPILEFAGGSVPITELDESVVETYTNDMQAKSEENLSTFRYLYRTQKIETLLLEGDNPASALLRYISDSGATSLVLGSSSSNYFSRTPKDSEVPSVVLKHAPDTCKIYVVSANKIISNSLNPMSTSDSKYKNYLSDVSHLPSHSRTTTFSSVDPDALKETSYQASEERLSDMSRKKEFPSISSTLSKQSDIRAEIEQLRLEVENTTTMYNQACQDLVHAHNRVHLLSSECIQEAQRVNAAQEREVNLRKIAALEREKYLEAEKEADVAKKLLAEETYERQMAELMIHKESLEKNRIVDALMFGDLRYRRYTRDDIHIATCSFEEDKLIGEGAYGKVYKCRLDHTSVAVKTLHPEASDRKKEFLKEVEVLSQLRHPHIVLLLGACPELGCLVYEYMENGSLEDHILPRRGRPPLPWPLRFRIAFEVACGLSFLHHTKPEPIVHRDLKPGNILLDKYYVSKIGDVGLAKFISDLVPDNITEYGESVIAGTLFYMDPEYQRTGTLRPKSDLYSFGVIVLQLLAARHPNGLIMKFENAMSSGNFSDVLDKSVADWPLAEAVQLIQVALNCCKLRCRDRPDLDTEVLPVLKKLAEFADSSRLSQRDLRQPPKHYYCPILQETMENPFIAADGFSYEHYAIEAWLDRHDVSPVTKQKLEHKMLIPNHMLRLAIQEWIGNNG